MKRGSSLAIRQLRYRMREHFILLPLHYCSIRTHVVYADSYVKTLFPLDFMVSSGRFYAIKSSILYPKSQMNKKFFK